MGTNDNQTFKIQCFLNCNTTYAVYAINCTYCNLRYVGLTQRQLKKRIAEHIADINHTIALMCLAPHTISLTSMICHLNILHFMR